MSAALGILLRKELLESIRTFRLPVVAGLFLFVGLSSPVLARYLPEIIELAGGEQLGVIEIPTPTATDAVDQLVKNLAQFGALTAILLAMGLVASEKDRERPRSSSPSRSAGGRSSARSSPPSPRSWAEAPSSLSSPAGSTPRSCSSRCRSSAGSGWRSSSRCGCWRSRRSRSSAAS